MAKFNRGLQNLLVAVDCPSCYLRFEPLRIKYAREKEKVWVDKGTEFKGVLEKLRSKEKIVNKNQRSPNRAIDRTKVLSTSTWSLKRQSFILSEFFFQTFNSRVNRVTKVAPNKITRNHVPTSVSIIANSSTILIQKPKFYVGRYVRIAKSFGNSCHSYFKPVNIQSQ